MSNSLQTKYVFRHVGHCCFKIHIFYDTVSVLDCILLNGRMLGEDLIRKDLEGSGDCLIKVLSWNFPGATEEYHQKAQSG
jgi:hypothetical protein